MAPPPLRVTVAVPTYRRPTPLARLLDSLAPAIAAVDADTTVRVLVVDNAPQADPAVAQACQEAPVGVDLHHEPTPGICAVRNTCVRLARGCDLLVFVDDDTTVHPRWLAALLEVYRETDADLVGSRITVSAPTASSRLRRSGLLDETPAPDRATMTEAWTCGLLLDYAVLAGRPEDEWFDRRLSTTGGEDVELTRRLHREGLVIRHAAGAGVVEHLPAERATFGWYARRYRRVGAVDAILAVPPRGRVRLVVEGLGRIAAGAAGLVSGVIRQRRVSAPAYRRLCRGVGFLEAASGRGHQEYARRAAGPADGP